MSVVRGLGCEIRKSSVQILTWYHIQLSSVAQFCLTLCNPMDCSTPGFPVHHQLPELAQAHVHLVGDDIQPSYPLSSPSPPAFNLSQHQGLFKGVSFSHQVAKGLELQEGCHYHYHGLASGQTTGREHSPAKSTENCIKDLLSMVLPIRIRPRFSHSQSLPSEHFQKPLIYQRADTMKTMITEN